jgi:membrane protein DedA with SNARE-associated domain
VLDLSQFWPVLVAFALLVAAGFGMPIPEELPTVGAGIWVASQPELGAARWVILPVCFVGVLISDVLLYGIGRLWGPHLLRYRWVTRLMPLETQHRIERNFHRYGVKMLLLIRWLPAIRSPMFITAGIMRLPLAYFVAADAIAAVFGHSLLFFLAFWFGDQFRDLILAFEGEVEAAKPLLVLLALAAVTAYLIYHFFRHPVATGDPREELPVIGGQLASKIEQAKSSKAVPPVSPDKQPASGILSNGPPHAEASQRDAIL